MERNEKLGHKNDKKGGEANPPQVVGGSKKKKIREKIHRKVC